MMGRRRAAVLPNLTIATDPCSIEDGNTGCKNNCAPNDSSPAKGGSGKDRRIQWRHIARISNKKGWILVATALVSVGLFLIMGNRSSSSHITSTVNSSSSSTAYNLNDPKLSKTTTKTTAMKTEAAPPPALPILSPVEPNKKKKKKWNRRAVTVIPRPNDMKSPMRQRYQPQHCSSKTQKAMQHLQVANLTNTTTRPVKVLCFVMTHSAYHATRLPAVWNTWGRRCDKLVILSDKTDTVYETISLQDVALDQSKGWLTGDTTRPAHSKSSYVQLWNKLNVTIQYVWDTYKDQGYDWYLKADDDSYVIVENLKHFLSNPEIVHRSEVLKTPLIFGRRYSWVKAGDLTSGQPVFRAFFNFTIPLDEDPRSNGRRKRRGQKRLNSTVINGDFRERFYQKFTNPDEPIVYAHGGAGYVMNAPYMEQFLKALNGPDTLRGIPAEDLAHGAVMLYHDVPVQKTRDELGRERFHPENPLFMYESSVERVENLVGRHPDDGPVRNGTDCCSSSTISFHHMDQTSMYEMDEILYVCDKTRHTE
jgi:glycoprotein-N-acetylgalactosamine 3-beta-galactosyltransferase